MQRLFALLCLTLLTTACAQTGGNSASDVLPGQESSTATTKRVLNTIGTPFHAVFKGTACVLGGAVAIPTTSALTMSGEVQDRELRHQVQKNVARTCSGPYTLGSD